AAGLPQGRREAPPSAVGRDQPPRPQPHRHHPRVDAARRCDMSAHRAAGVTRRVGSFMASPRVLTLLVWACAIGGILAFTLLGVRLAQTADDRAALKLYVNELGTSLDEANRRLAELGEAPVTSPPSVVAGEPGPAGAPG